MELWKLWIGFDASLDAHGPARLFRIYNFCNESSAFLQFDPSMVVRACIRPVSFSVLCESRCTLAAFSGLVLKTRKNENRVGVKRTAREHT